MNATAFRQKIAYLSLFISSFSMTNCLTCHDRACSRSGLDIRLVRENGTPVTGGNFRVVATLEGATLQGDCSFTATTGDCRLFPTKEASKDISGSVDNRGGNKGLVIDLVVREGENFLGPSSVNIEIFQGETLLGAETFRPMYEIDNPNPKNTRCSYCEYATEQMVIAAGE